MSDDNSNPLDLSDEDIMNMPEPEDVVEDIEDSIDDNTANEGDASDEDIADNDGDENAEEEEDAEDSTKNEEVEEKDEVDDSTLEDDSSDEDEPDTDLDINEDVDGKESKTPTKVDNAVDFEAEYKKLLQPFRASGRDVNVNSVDEAIQLMQMGADYNKKMAGLKPSMKLLKMLENNELLEESKLSYLIDLSKKNPEAITKLIKDSGIDPLEVDVNADTEYKPNTYTVDDKQVELDNVLADIEHTDSYSNTIDIISNKWDESSKRVLYDNPADIKFINDQVSSGVYGQIDAMVQNQRMLGNLKGLSDIDAYKAVGSYMQENRLFSGQSKAPVITPATIAPDVNNANQNPKLKNRKKAASGTKTAPTKKKKMDFNPLDLSDEEMEKMTAPII